MLPALGRIRLRRLTHSQINALYDRLLAPSPDRPALTPKTVYELHLVIRRADDALRLGLVTKNVALAAQSPLINAARRPEARSWTEDELRQFLRAANGHRFFPLLWLSAMTGMRRNEVLGIKWEDIDFKRQRLSLNRVLVAIGYEVHQSRGKTRNARRPIDLDNTTLSVLEAWRVQAPRRGDQRRPRRVGVHRGDANPSTHTRSPRRSSGSPATPGSPPSACTSSAIRTARCSSRRECRSRS